MLARAISLRTLMAAAYGVPPLRVVFSTDIPEEKVDVLMTVPGGSKEMLQAEIKKQYGLTASPECERVPCWLSR